MSDDKEATDLALKRYDTLLRYFVYENTVFWTRSQFFLVANAGLFAVFAARFSDSYGMQAALALIGGFIAFIWLRTLKSGKYWIVRWEKLCCELEEKAFGDSRILRECRPNGHISTKSSAVLAAWLFLTMWSIALIWTVYQWSLMEHFWPLICAPPPAA